MFLSLSVQHSKFNLLYLTYSYMAEFHIGKGLTAVIHIL